jgi:hypothetical protein
MENKKVIIYYTDNALDENILKLCQEKLIEAAKPDSIPIISVGKEHCGFGDISVSVGDRNRSHSEMFYQIKTGLEIAAKEFQPTQVFCCEHDIVYNPSHFEFTVPPEEKRIYHYNEHKVYYDWKTDRYYNMKSCNLSTLTCGFRLLLSHTQMRNYRSFILKMPKGGFTTSEPGRRNDYTGNVSLFNSCVPLIDIRHSNNLSTVTLEPAKEIKNHDMLTALKEIIKWQK